jgi:hypothetical protein
MSLAHCDPQTFRTPLALRQRKFSANWSRALVLGTLAFATLNSRHGLKMQVRLLQANLIPSTQTSHKSLFNGIMPARKTDPAHFFVVEQEEEGDQTT